MENEKKLFTVTNIFIIIAILCIIASLTIFDGVLSQWVFFMSFLSLIALIMIKWLEQSGRRALLWAAYPFLCGFFKLIQDTEFAQSIVAFYNGIIKKALSRIAPSSSFTLNGQEALLVTMFLLFFILLFISSAKSSPVIKKHTKEGRLEFREKKYANELKGLCTELSQNIKSIDRSTNWNVQYYVPLKAEVEVNTTGTKRRKYKDLLKCLKKTNHGNGVYLVLGNPGSGKSVALRKLCIDLLKEAPKTGIVPLYINLKEWEGDWDVDHLPSQKDLIQFIEKTLHNLNDCFIDSIVDEYFKKMLDYGRWYFVFDSFDEMPCLMGKKACRVVIDHISELIYKLLTAPNQIGGIVASRQFKAPTESIHSSFTLTIQDFNDLKIKQTIKGYLPHNSESVIREMFGTREDLVHIARNPFSLSLIITYIQTNAFALPQKQLDLYESFINQRLDKCMEKIEHEKLTKEDVIIAATDLAVFMQESESKSLDAPIAVLSKWKYDDDYWKRRISVLVNSKICRTEEKQETVTFVHRRFQEFFIVRNFLQQNKHFVEEDYKCILENTGLRDAIALYCEIVEDVYANEIASYCCNAIIAGAEYRNSIKQKETQYMINAICFLGEAFRNKKEVLHQNSYFDEVESVIAQFIRDRKTTHFAVLNCISKNLSIFSDAFISEMIPKMLHMDNIWINDNILTQCRFLKNANTPEIVIELIQSIGSMPYKILFRDFKNMQFSLAHSDNLLPLRKYHLWLFISHLLLCIISISTLVVLCIWAATNQTTAFHGRNTPYPYAVLPLGTFVLFAMTVISRGFSSFFIYRFYARALRTILKQSSTERDMIKRFPRNVKALAKRSPGYKHIPILQEFSKISVRDTIYIGIIAVCCLYLMRNNLNTVFFWIVCSFLIVVFLCVLIPFIIVIKIDNRAVKANTMTIHKVLKEAKPSELFSFIITSLIITAISGLLTLLLVAVVRWKAAEKVIPYLSLIILLIVFAKSIYNLVFDKHLRRSAFTDTKAISRIQLMQTISKMHYRFSVNKYLETMILEGITLDGEWPENFNELDADIRGMIAKIECADPTIQIRL